MRAHYKSTLSPDDEKLLDDQKCPICGCTNCLTESDYDGILNEDDEQVGTLVKTFCTNKCDMSETFLIMNGKIVGRIEVA